MALLPYCEYCGKETGILPFVCNYCGGTFCAKHRLPENHECSLDLEYRNKVFKERKRKTELRRKVRYIGVRGRRSIVGTYLLYIIVIIPSILAFFYPYYLCISYFTIYQLFTPYPFIWTIFTSLFVVYFSNIAEFIYFVILLFFSYYFIRTIENKYGPKRLLYIFFGCSVLGGVIYLIIYFFYGYFSLISFFPIGLASSGLLGLCLFSLLDSHYKSWHFSKYSLKASYVIWFLVLFNICSKIASTALSYGAINPFIEPYFMGYLVGFNIPWYIYDYFGLLGAVVLYQGYFKRNY
ncbi:MAG: hypothetical protein EU517_00475 [Promethearchaeota archaeon]|nr:MAG: hypothetical protein EU517_00475 [Candidatus Lokiarchaeota archaeon]